MEAGCVLCHTLHYIAGDACIRNKWGFKTLFGELAIAYLFLGGVGAGCVCAASLLDLTIVKEPFGNALYMQGPSVNPSARIIDYAFAASFFLLLAGCSCLIFDLGRLDRIVYLFINPTQSWMTIGVYSLAILIVLGAFLAFVRFFYFPCISRGLVFICELAAIVLACVVMLYTGFLLDTLAGAALWRSSWLPLLFMLSSVSGGIAALGVISAFVFKDQRCVTMLRVCAIVDCVVILIEVIAAAGFLFAAQNSDNPGAIAGAHNLTTGAQSIIWWVGFVICGIAFPLIAELIFVTNSKRFHNFCNILVAAGIAVLIGVVCLRVSVVDAGEMRDPALMNVPSKIQIGSFNDVSASNKCVHDKSESEYRSYPPDKEQSIFCIQGENR